MYDPRGTAFASPNHGGLTPAALVNVRSHIAKIAISSAIRTPCNQERGASAPRGFTTATAPAFVSAPMAVSRDFAEAFLQVRFPNTHGGLTNVAPGRTCVCASQKSFFAGGYSHTNRRAGGVSPPWVRYRDCTGVRERTDGGRPRLCGSVPESAFPGPRRAHERRSCERAFAYRKNRHFSGGRTLYNPAVEHRAIRQGNTIQATGRAPCNPAGNTMQSRGRAWRHSVGENNAIPPSNTGPFGDRTPGHPASEYRATMSRGRFFT
jgi:hypothetical protein